MTKNIIPCTKPDNPRFKDLTGMTFNRLTVIGLAGYQPKNATPNSRRFFWVCVCSCGNEFITESSKIKNGHTQSCGCYMIDRIKEVNTTHGESHKTPEFYVWTSMIQRCSSPNTIGAKHYFLKGITVCDRWRGKSGYMNFLIDMKRIPTTKHTIERHNTGLGYSPENCSWQTQKVNQNNRTNNHRITINGETKTISMWSDVAGISQKTISNRINKLGWEEERAVFEPIHIEKRQKTRKKVA